MFYLILEFQTNVEIDNGKTTKILPPLLYAWIVPPGNTAAGCSKVNHPTKTIHHHNVQILYHGTLYRQTDRQTDRQIGRQAGRQADWRSLSEAYLGTFETLWWNVFLPQDIWQATLIFDGRPRWEKCRVIDSTFWMDIWIYVFLNKIFIFFCSNHPTED